MNTKQNKYSISLTLPSNFTADLNVAGCYITQSDKVLLLQVCKQKDESGRWGVPAGKIDKNELPKEAALRELYEETTIVAKQNKVEHFATLYITKPHISYIYNMFSIIIPDNASVVISSEHQAYMWVSFNEAFKLPLMYAAKEALMLYKMHQRGVYA
jgi:8-oxo-dGTP diphosphatase